MAAPTPIIPCDEPKPFGCVTIRQVLTGVARFHADRKWASGVCHCIKIGYVAIVEVGEWLLVFFNLGSAVARIWQSNYDSLP
ncbi:MAG TPA: hypothetical protein VMR25_20605, partial [Planctomycetaceae bacterium]|nr:hypothetical protein [Planctomycetaceae bacterium]